MNKEKQNNTENRNNKKKFYNNKKKFNKKFYYQKKDNKIRLFTINKHDLVIHKIIDVVSEEDRALMKIIYDNNVSVDIRFNSIDEMKFWRRKLKRVIEKNAQKEENSNHIIHNK